MLHAARILLCVLLCTAPALSLLAQGAPASSAAAVQQHTAQTPHQAHLQAERREEIQQRKIDNPEEQDGVNVYRHSPMVHSFAHAFGLSIETTARMFEVINFLLLVVIIIWFLARMLPRTLRARSQRIQSDIAQARIATEEANRRLAAVEERLSRLDSEIAAIRTRAEHETVEEEQRLRAALDQEKQAILAAANQDIQAAGKNAEAQLRRLAATLVIDHAERQIAVTPASDQAIVERFLKDTGNGRGGVN